MKGRLSFLIAAALLLGGCAGSDLPPQDEARLACRNEHPPQKGSFVAYVTCLNAVDDQYVRPDDPDADLLDRLEAGRMTLAKDVDIGEITPADYESQMSQLESQLNVERDRRTMQRARSSWGISHGLDSTRQGAVVPVPVTPPN